MSLDDASSAPAWNGTLLKQLCIADRELLAPDLERVPARRGQTLFESGSELDWVYFPHGTIVSIQERCDHDYGIEVGLVGSEGMVGWGVLLGGGRATHRAWVRTDGSLVRLPVEALLKAVGTREMLRMILLRYVHSLTVQLSRSLVSHLHDPVLRRLARWLLMRHDRMPGDEIEVQHDEIAGDLDVRRASITDALHVIEGERLVRCYRRRLLIRDRAGLERLAGSSYGQAEAAYNDAVGQFGKTVRTSERSPLPKPVAAPLAVGTM